MKKYLLIAAFLYFMQILYAGVLYTVYQNQTVRDQTTGLLWTRCSLMLDMPNTSPNCGGNISNYSWESAIDVCNNLEFGDRSDWRLPNIKELHSIVYYTDYETPAINTKAFPRTVLNHYWSSTTHKNNDNLAWSIDFMYGNVTFQIKDDNGLPLRHYVRCVAGPD